MPKQYTQEELWKLYDKLPEELKSALSGADTANHIWDICERYEIDEVSKVAKLVGNVLLGVLVPEDFQEKLEKELKIDQETAKKLTQEINRFIFYPVRPVLENLHKLQVTPEQKVIREEPTVGVEEETISERGSIREEKPSTPSQHDTYREPIE